MADLGKPDFEANDNSPLVRQVPLQTLWSFDNNAANIEKDLAWLEVVHKFESYEREFG